MYHDAIDARSKNEHFRNIGIMKSLLLEHKPLVENLFSHQITNDKIAAMLHELNYGNTDSSSTSSLSSYSIKTTSFANFQHNLSREQIVLTTQCINSCKLFKEEVSSDMVSAFFDCKLSTPFTSNNNRWLSLFFEGLSNADLITRNWKVVIERNNLLYRPSGRGFIQATDLYSALSQANSRPPSSNEKRIIDYLGQIYKSEKQSDE